MKINGINKISQIYKANKVSNIKKVNSQKKKDSLQVSNQAKEIQIANNAARKVSSVRQEKVDEIKKRIESNNYNIDSKEVAKKMISQGFQHWI